MWEHDIRDRNRVTIEECEAGMIVCRRLYTKRTVPFVYSFKNNSYLCSRYNNINSYSYGNGTIWNFRNVFRF